ncbi:riboflavin biosynthesis protein RibF [Secundilactobacillus paracollinoides]|uniref:Riboflavin biosynthesis protein n=1 Tax=Secundilactobacillus paracollinoides TaxID=240427 RepID=A0A1B2J0G7_9LACO|nr:riboflavin biosynthesis protein RibF [Secundilactobacillus paracollinoides]ANZ67793.1 bifunctional riboflavin kinase/FMN adenylyltransferase [Secundilactobacillus paracollinoides]
MQVIQIHHPMSADTPINKPIVLAMGFFDGLHLGHQAVIKRAKTIAEERGLPLAVLTYDHHPKLVYAKLSADENKYLTTRQRKLDLFEKLGVDIVYMVNFTSQFSALKPQEFVDEYLMGFHAQVVVAGFDHTYGPKDIATMARLPEYAQERFAIVTVGEQEIDHQKISSSRIRRNITDGDIKTVNELLGYHYQTIGTVVHGEARGRTIGFPTANVSHDVHYWLPAVGVYVTRIKIGDTWYPSVTSVGHNVTFGEGRPVTVEVYIIDFNEAVYGEVATVEWCYRLRGEEKFASVDALVTQMTADTDHARQYLAHDFHELALD